MGLFISFNGITLRRSPERDDDYVFKTTDWEWSAGQNWAIAGANGSGKSCFAGTVARPVNVAEGKIRYFFGDTEDGRSYPEYGEIAVVSPDAQSRVLNHFSSYHQSRWQSFEGGDIPAVSDYLSSGWTEGGSRPICRESDEEVYSAELESVITHFGIAHLMTSKLHQLSNGECRKVILARAVLNRPRLLILDDPFEGLDTASRTSFSEIIDSLISRDGPHVLFVTTRPSEIPGGISHLIHIDNHKVIAAGPLNDVAKTLPNDDDNAALQYHADSVKYKVPAELLPECRTGEIILEMKHVSVSYGGTSVLDDVSWTVKQGECWLLTGSNGAGKSTLISMILADNPQAYANGISLFGVPHGSGNSIWDIRKKIGWVSPELHDYYDRRGTCRDVVCSGFYDSVGLFRRPLLRHQSAADAWMDVLDIGRTRDLTFAALSTSDQRLVLICRALVKSPPLLILDEPCQSLDRSQRQSVLSLLDSVCGATGISLIFVTHHHEEIPACVTRRIRLENGRIVHVGSPN